MANRYFQQFYYSFIKKLTGLHGYAELVQAVKAKVIAQGVTYTAKVFGVDGNGITITLVAGGTAGAEVVTVSGKAISVEIEDGVTTQTQLKTALEASVPAAALLTIAVASGSTAVSAAAAVTTTGGVDGVASFVMPGVESFVRSGVGEYTLTLKDGYVAICSVNAQLQAATAVDLVPQIKSVDVVSAKTVVINLLAGATPTEVAAAARLYVDVMLRNSSVAY